MITSLTRRRRLFAPLFVLSFFRQTSAEEVALVSQVDIHCCCLLLLYEIITVLKYCRWFTSDDDLRIAKTPGFFAFAAHLDPRIYEGH
jgi:hypothetical protein